MTADVIAMAAVSIAAPKFALASSTGPLRTSADVLRWLDAIAASPKARSTEGWPLAQVLEHLAQSVLFSLDGFPQPKSALFQNTAGSAAFAMFKWRGKMSHGLTEPIPGAPALKANTVAEGAQMLRSAALRFDAHKGQLKPHFAYGDLPKADYALAHALHVQNHAEQIVLG
jgi:hypothetical protein